MPFIPEVPKEERRVPYYEEARAADGWQGQTTNKSIKELQDEIERIIMRLGGMVESFQKGTFESEQGNRDGYRIDYFVKAGNGRHMPGRIDIAALPIDPELGHRADKDKHRENSLKMALFMLHVALAGTWFLQQLSPGFSALVPFMLGPGDKTISELWTDGPMSRLLPPGNTEDFSTVEGEIING
jgi:hypothetical protein